jgi:phenylalanine-4-hydroxylase
VYLLDRDFMDEFNDLEESNLLSELRSHCVPQEHERYTAADHAVWAQVLNRSERLVEKYADVIHPAYLDGLRELELPRHVPRIEELNERLQSSGWRTVCVDGYIPNKSYVELMARRIFPVSRSIRRPEHIDFAPAPDLVHDVLGHLPMLFSLEHGEFNQRLAFVMSNAVSSALDEELYAVNRRVSALKGNPASAIADVREAEETELRIKRELLASSSEQTHLARMYLWAIEFGLVRSPRGRWIHGAALLSSPTEFAAASSDDAEVVPYSLDVIDHDIEFSDLQGRYFAARDFDHLHDVLTLYESSMQFRKDEARASETRALGPTRKRARYA